MTIRTQKVRLYPNRTMKKVLDDLCNYRRYCWNQGLALWNDMYEASLILGDKSLLPDEYKVRNELTANIDYRHDVFGLPFPTWETLGKTFLTKCNLTGANLSSSPRKLPDRDSRPTELKLLMASYDWTNRTESRNGMTSDLKALNP